MAWGFSWVVLLNNTIPTYFKSKAYYISLLYGPIKLVINFFFFFPGCQDAGGGRRHLRHPVGPLQVKVCGATVAIFRTFS